MDDEACAMDFAERLSLWVSAFDAIGLQASLQSIRTLPAAAEGKVAPARGPRTPDLVDDFQKVRSVLARAIAQDPLSGADAADGADAGYAPYHRRHLELQRQMEQMTGALRGHVRQAVSRLFARREKRFQRGIEGGQLPQPRRQALLPKGAALLKLRFEQLRLSDDGAARFARHWQEALLAELDLRLEPVAGLIDALGTELKNRP